MLNIYIILHVDQFRAQHSLIFYLPYNNNYFQWEFSTLVKSHTLKLVYDVKKIVTM